MASSNRHWPSLFKSKPCNSHHHWQHESYLLHGYNRNPYSSASGCEERTPEPKPRWNPKPEQIRILEAIFNSGMVNPPRDEIRKIRAQLQEFGQVGDANVFYWFQNRKSRSKHKLRHVQSSSKSHQNNTPPVSVATTKPPIDPAYSSSSSSEKSSLTSKVTGGSLPKDVSSTAVASTEQAIFLTTPSEFLTEPFLYPSTEGVSFADGTHGLFIKEMVQHDTLEERNLMGKMMEPQMGYTMAPPIVSTDTINPVSQEDHPPAPLLGSSSRSTVVINDVVFDIAAGRINVREAFGNDTVLVHSSGQPVLTDEWGFTVQSLQAGGLYYLLPLSFLDPHI